ncbi:cellulase-like family protein [Sphingomonas sp. 1P08PE]|uniref:cellulase-like family protein n=1 Tax=Sphingomonas sp. 1P08PE TaxID=554122 RepID=UPI00399F82E6
MTEITRKDLLIGIGAAAVAGVPAAAAAPHRKRQRPLAIAMWDFSWLERRWPGAGYEDWDVALRELVERGYDAVRIDAYPHLVAADGTREWLLKPVWNNQDWGAPTLTRVSVLPSLVQFIGRCRAHGVRVALSTWFREDADNTRNRITSPDALADIWRQTLRAIERAGLLEQIVYVDFCNEWPGPIWATFLDPPLQWGAWRDPRSLDWMRRSIASLRADYPDMPLLFSGTAGEIADYASGDAAMMDACEYHIWMANGNRNEFAKAVGYKGDRFSDEGYRNLQLKAYDTYAGRRDYWRKLLTDQIAAAAAASRTARLPMITTECWGIVDYKDWPLLRWDWVKELCTLGTLTASQTGRWLAISTSNFCGPQFQGMWRDIAWHRALTRAIKAGPVDPALQSGRLWAQLGT